MSTMREESRRDWTSKTTTEDINCGSLQRIADATEKMALRYTELIDKAARLEKNNDLLRGYIEGRDKTISNMRGQITKLKKKLAVQP